MGKKKWRKLILNTITDKSYESYIHEWVKIGVSWLNQVDLWLNWIESWVELGIFFNRNFYYYFL